MSQYPAECPVCTRWKRCADHNRCDDCGTRDKLCYYREGLLCERCHTGRVDDRIAAFDGDTDYTSEITCPHCGYVHSDSWEMSEGEQECSDCERPFEVERVVTVEYRTAKITRVAAKE